MTAFRFDKTSEKKLNQRISDSYLWMVNVDIITRLKKYLFMQTFAGTFAVDKLCYIFTFSVKKTLTIDYTNHLVIKKFIHETNHYKRFG